MTAEQRPRKQSRQTDLPARPPARSQVKAHLDYEKELNITAI